MAKTADTATGTLPPALASFDQLPDSAHVGVEVVASWRGISTRSVWRQSKPGGRLPAPNRLSDNRVGWNVGALRRAVASGNPA